MANWVTLHELVDAIAGSIIEAQRRVQEAQIVNLRGFFDEQLRPKELLLRVPSVRANQSGAGEDLCRVPLLALAPPSPLRIRDAEIRFAVQMSDLARPGDDPAHPAPRPLVRMARTRGAAPADKGAAPAGEDAAPDDEGGVVHIVLRVEGHEVPEGQARLIGELLKTQGILGPVAAGAAERERG